MSRRPWKGYNLYSPELAARVIKCLEMGETFQAITSRADMPARPTIVSWRQRMPEFDAMVRAALVATNRAKPRFSAKEKWAFYYDIAIPYDGEDCLIWPYPTSKGYAAIWQKKEPRIFYISRLLCELEHGPPPTDTHEAAHLCGRGKFGCVTRKHLVWKTVQENNWDKDAHGTRVRGESHPDAKLTEADVIEIRRRAANGEAQCHLAEEFAVGKSTMHSIVTGKTWRYLLGPIVRVNKNTA